MPYCTGCGDNLGSATGVCPKCGTPVSVGAQAPAATTPPGSSAAGTALEENVAGLLCYVLGWLTGLVFFLIDKRPFVRFHAAQSMLTFGAIHVIQIFFMMGGMAGGTMGGMMGGFMFGGITWMLFGLLNFLIVIAWIVCMVKAYQGERYKLPIVGGIAENFAK
jgi:uncharacterized membrane protein